MDIPYTGYKFSRRASTTDDELEDIETVRPEKRIVRILIPKLDCLHHYGRLYKKHENIHLQAMIINYINSFKIVTENKDWLKKIRSYDRPQDLYFNKIKSMDKRVAENVEGTSYSVSETRALQVEEWCKTLWVYFLAFAASVVSEGLHLGVVSKTLKWIYICD